MRAMLKLDRHLGCNRAKMTLLENAIEKPVAIRKIIVMTKQLVATM